MVIKLNPKFSKNQVKAVIQQQKKRFEDAIVLRLNQVGDEFVTNARNNGNYSDQTGNLRSSVGYAIIRNGVQITVAGFQPVSGSARGRQTLLGKAVGLALLDQAMQRFPTGIVLICVAGMNYAAAVESKNYDVITGSSLTAEFELKKAFERFTK